MNTPTSSCLSAPAAGLPAKDFSYTSGERQTATAFGDIRRDHTARYVLATDYVKQGLSPSPVPLEGLDLFCGNGYGTWLAANQLHAHVLGIDGCEEAIAIAHRHYRAERATFVAKLFPFALPTEAYDFIFCFESIEHVNEPEALFAALARALKPGGLLFVSTPNEATMPLALNAQWFRHHVRHFRVDELVGLARQQGELEIRSQFGQKVYRLQRGRVGGIDETLDMLPQADCVGAHFFIQVFAKSARANSAASTGAAG